MIEMLDRMVGDTLWRWTGIVGSIFGALFIAYMRDTRIGLWVYGKWDYVLDFIRDRYGWTWFNQDADAWRKVSPNIAKKIDQIEARVKELEKEIGRK